MIKNQIMREWLMVSRQVRYSLNGALFFLMILVFFPLTLPADQRLLTILIPGLVWTALLLSLLLSADRLFQQDYEDGVVEQWLVSGQPLVIYVLSKAGMHWLASLIPLLIMMPLIPLFFGLDYYATIILVIALIAGSPALLLLCALASVFSGGLRQQGVIMALILLPLALPIMIFGSAVVESAQHGLPVLGFIALLLALSLLCVTFLPIAIATMMRITLIN